jgi:hypothetical protein
MPTLMTMFPRMASIIPAGNNASASYDACRVESLRAGASWSATQHMRKVTYPRPAAIVLLRDAAVALYQQGGIGPLAASLRPAFCAVERQT